MSGASVHPHVCEYRCWREEHFSMFCSGREFYICISGKVNPKSPDTAVLEAGGETTQHG